jgi:four helix bundle protein
MATTNLQTKVNKKPANTKAYDLEERTLEFSKRALQILKGLPQNTFNTPIISQVVRSITAIGANYIEAKESLGKKDFIMRVRISRKEAKESCYWLRILVSNNNGLQIIKSVDELLDESFQLLKILSKIIENSSNKA